ncbi:MAG TPA: hypothetical protein VN380_26535 [Thermoanaerobaculia bacterium]|nr:hypothetical protein [Thermoanaerobaculia bacterium]
MRDSSRTLKEQVSKDVVAWTDPRVEAYVLASGEDRTGILAELLAGVRPLMERIVSSFRRTESVFDDQDAEDAIATAVLRVIRRLDDAAASRHDAIMELDEYVATITYNAVHDIFRRRFPERSRLNNRLRYAAKHDVRLALQTTRAGVAVALAGSAAHVPLDGVPIVDASIAFDPNAPAEAIVRLLQTVGVPVMLDTVTSFLASRWGISTHPRAVPDAERWVDADQFQRLESRRFLETLWREVAALGPLHRAAVLLNLRERDGGNAAALFIFLGIATFEEIAGALQMRVGELAEIWNALPLDDRTIAERLKMTRQQVINLRKTARERLGRRLAPFLRK